MTAATLDRPRVEQVPGQLDHSQASSRTGYPLPARPWNGLTVLDCCCCAGGAGMGYYLAGYDVVGVDIIDRPRYPFPFIKGDAVEYVLAHGHEYDLIHASWPCQRYTALTKGTNRRRGKVYPDLIAPGREAMLATGRPYVIENVPGAPLRPDLTLCGTQFGRPFLRHRVFEVHGWFAMQPQHQPHRDRVRGYRHGVRYDGGYLPIYGDGGDKATVPEIQAAFGMPWTDVREELTEAIPPAYTQFIGDLAAEQILAERLGVAA
ncbi:DNA methylase [Streptomyces sp. NBC_01456]|uniref:DNA methylase n=1 Tax=unclassified Streptomyces TaxID=2593676 RepID=UPI002E35A321|nr:MULTISPECIES: DNA methylase [unclassified Streptomyces]